LSVLASGRKNVRRIVALQARYLLVVGLAVVLGLSVALPVFAADGGIQPRVVGGEPVPNGDYPFVASLGNVRYGTTAYGRHFCGASLIDSDSVLTAAHCAQGTPKRLLRVTVGRTVLSGSGGRTRRVSRIDIHPRFTGKVSNGYDAAVLTLNNPVGGIPAIWLAGTPQDALEQPGRLATVAGWGNTIEQPPRGSNGTDFPDRMRAARVPIVSDARARDVYGRSYVRALMVAAGKEGKDTCSGDSGGPMFARQGDKRYQIGITSFGSGCAARGYPGVYTEVNARAIRTFIVNAAGL
jgi:secreted trypsin-like serine protease